MTLRFFSGSVTPLQRLQEALLGVDPDHLHAHVPREGGHHLVALVQAQQAGVDEHAGQLVADGPVQQRADHRRIHAAGQPRITGRAHLLLNPRDHVVDDVVRGPEVLAAADLVHEARQDALALTRVRDLGVKLQAVEAAFLVGHPGDRSGIRGARSAGTRAAAR
jgi:hypothetical protein